MRSVTAFQRGILIHSLGLKVGDDEYRNYYAAEQDSKECNALVAMGLMRKGKVIEGGLQYFHVTDSGKQIARKESE